MKKFLSLLLALTLVFSLAACRDIDDPNGDDNGDNDDNGNGEVDTTPPTFSGVEDVEIFMDSTFDPLDGITATDNQGNDITSDITVIGTVDTSKIGSNYLRYSVEDEDGNKTEVPRYVTVVVDPSLVGDEMVPNGDFSLGTAYWTMTTGLEGGNATYSVVDGELKIDITSVSGGFWEPRLENIGITFEQGQSYKVSFDARALEQRPVHVQVGELLSSAPWFRNFKQGQTEIFDLTTEMQSFEFVFTMTLDTNDNGAMIFEFGTVPGGEGFDNYITTVFLDNVIIEESEPVYSEPIIEGANDVTIETGTTFDPLAGVTARDLVEGDLTLTLDNVTGTVDTDTPGEYTLTYTVSNTEGLSTTVTRKVTVVDLVFKDTTIVRNGDFEAELDAEDPEWTLWQADWDPNDSPMTDGSLSIVNNQLVLEVNSIGTWGYQGWLLQASQNISLQHGYTYKLVFEAKAAEARQMNAIVGFSVSDEDWRQHGGGVVDLTTEMQTFEFIFTKDQSSMDFQEVIKFEFGQADATITIDNVEILILDEEPLQSNGTFEESGWHMWYQNWGDAPGVNYEIVDGEMVITITGSLGDANWAIQFLQENIAMEPGESYRVTFDAKSDHARDINFKFIEGAAGGAEFWQAFSITETMDTYTFDFDFTSDFDFGRISVEMGAIGDAVPGVITLDNISIVKLDDQDAVVEGSDVVTNGTFDEILYWNHWSQDWENIPTVSKEVVNGELVMTIADTLGDESWSVQLFQGVEGLREGAWYVLEFEARASEARDINAKMIAGGGMEVVEIISLTDEMVRYTVVFEYPFEATGANINFELGNFEGALPGTITFDNVMLYRTFNE